ncbi:MAG TPA: hypothetical protein VGF36_11260, partial [Rhodopila sp.]
MDTRRRHFPSLLTLALAAATPALGQPAAPAAAGLDNSGTQGIASIPDFAGVWAHPSWPSVEPPLSGPGPVLNRSRLRTGEANGSLLVGDYTNPILKPAAAAIVKRHGEISSSGMTYPTPSNRCWPSGVPYIFFQPGVQMLQLPHQIVFLYLRGPEFRHVRLNEAHPANVAPSWYGDSVGRYEGDTLVIDTVAQKADRPVAMVDM